MSMKELDALCRGIGFRPFKVTVTGGEPFTHPGIEEFLHLMASVTRPAVLVLPTNGSLPDRIRDAVMMLVRIGKGMETIVNLSVDGPGAVHDRHRGSGGSFDRVLETYESLIPGRGRNLKIGFNITVSDGNKNHLEETCRLLAGLKPDHIIMEPAGERNELFNAGAVSQVPIAALKDLLLRNARFLDESGFSGHGRLHRAARLEYYRTLDPRYAEGRCYAGAAAIYIHPDGQVSACPVRDLVLGDLRCFRFNLGELLSKEEADRGRAAARKCSSACTLADAFYFNRIFGISGFGLRSLTRNVRRRMNEQESGELVGSDAH